MWGGDANRAGLLGRPVALRWLLTPRPDIGGDLNTIYYEHSSNAGLARENQGLNNAGLRLGLAF